MRRFGLLLVTLVIVFIIGLIYWNTSLTPVNPRDKSEVLFVVPQGAGLKAISRDLKEKGLIKNPLIFTLMVQQSGLAKKIQAGDFRLSPSMTSQQIAQALTKAVLDIWVTIPEGKRAEEVAEILKDRMPNFDPSWEQQLIQHEGYLFPETYLIPRNASIENIIQLLTNTFDEKYKEVNTGRTNLTKDQIVTIASLIEREARHDEDRPLISSVIHNRLEIGMALQIDATVQYALGYNQFEKNWWTKGLSLSDLKVSSPYNTYTNPGLPPGPIASPGLKALQAAANPANTNYLYYITDRNGINHYAKTNAEHEANIRKYGL